MWANIALLNGYQKGTKLINLVEKEMTPSQIKTAQDLTRECVHKEYEGCGETKSVDASASVLNLKCTNRKNIFYTTYEIDIENKTITLKTSLWMAKKKKRIINKKMKIISFEEPYAITMNKSKYGNISFKIFYFDKKTYSQSTHSEMCQRCEPNKKPYTQFYTCVNSD
tara:strand:+ start:380 stop:883 length:504 start_codon:yes stop_codon:yes gene_type:complete